MTTGTPPRRRFKLLSGLERDLRSLFVPFELAGARDFKTYSTAKTAQFVRVVTVIGAMNLVFWLPTDFVVYADVRVRNSMIAFRLVYALLVLAAVSIMRRVPFTDLDPIGLGAISYYFMIVSGMGAMGVIAGDQSPLVFTSFIAPSMTIVFLIPLRERVAVSTVASLLALLAFYAPHPEHLDPLYTGMAVVFLAFVTSVNVAIGHLMYRMEEAGFAQRIQLAANAERLEDQNKTKDAFLATVSHELRTPLNAIIGLTDVMMDDRLPPEHRQYVRTIDRSGQVLLSLINNILDLAKIKAGKLELEALPYSPFELVEASASVFSMQCAKKGVELVTLVPAATPMLVGDAARLNQILLNLVGNAVKFTDAGEIRIAASCDMSGAAGPRLIITVSDTGPGIPERKRETVFEEFTQADASITRKYGGTGLGLPIVRKLARLMGGDVTVSANEPRGAVFTVNLPTRVAEGVADDQPRLPPALVVSRPLAVLSVAHPVIRQRLTEELTALGLRVETGDTLSGAIDAVQRAQDERQDVRALILDQPSLTPEVLRASGLVRDGRLCAPTIVMLPAGVDGAAYRAMGVAQILQRPSSRIDLRDALQQLLAGTAPKPVEAPPLPAPAASAHAPNILVVDDVPENRVLIAAFLKKANVTAEYAENGLQALARFQKGGLDEVFLDIEMPEMDGYTAASRMRAFERENGLRPVPIIALSAHQDFEHQQRARDVGFTHHLTKPLRRQEFLATVQEYAPGGSPRTPSAALRRIASTEGLRALTPPSLEPVRAIYLRQRREDAARVRRWIDERAFDNVREVGESLKGDGRAHGLGALAAIGSEMEQAARAKDAMALIVLVRRLEASLESEARLSA